MHMRSIPLLIGGLVSHVAAQINAGSPGISIENSPFKRSALCNRTFADANSSGIVTFDPVVTQGQQSLQPASSGFLSNSVSWAGTVHQEIGPDSNNLTELSLWFSPNGANYSDNFALGYDVCYMWIFGTTFNTFARGQSDNGTCLDTLDAACISDLQNMSDRFVTELVGSPTPGPDSNLTTNSLPTVCANLAEMMTDNFPESCDPFFNSTRRIYGGPPALGGALTGNQSLVERSFCEMNGTFSLMWSQFSAGDLLTYYIANYWVAPLITVFLPIADSARPVTLAAPKSFLSCLRANKVNPGSAPVPPGPSPTPITSQSGSDSEGRPGPSSTETMLSVGEIIGIVVGAVAGLLAILALIFGRRWIEQLTARRGVQEVTDRPGTTSKEMERKATPVEMPYTSVAEIGSPYRGAELSDRKSTGPVELPGNDAWHRHPSELEGK